MARDFLTSQIRTHQIIASRSMSSTPSLLIISASNSDGTGGVINGSPSDPNIFLFVTGSRGNDASTLFGGSVFVSGTLKSFDGISGSLQRTISGLSYLVAGGGINVVSASNGQITISSIGVAGGTNTQVQFNDAGILNGDDGLVYNKTTKTLTVGNLFATGSITSITTSNLSISDAVIYLASGSAGPNVKSVIAFASGSKDNDKSLIFGSLGANDTIVAARQDVSGGLVTSTNLSFVDLVPIRASKFELGSSIALTSSDGLSATFYSAGSGFIDLVPGSIGLKIGNSLYPTAVSGSTVRIGGANFPPIPGSDTFFFVSGSLDGTNKSVLGGDTLISGSLSQGRLNTASGKYSHAEGWSNNSSGDYSHAEGVSTVASGLYSHAEGNDTTASGEGAHVEGDRGIASGNYSHSEGLLTVASRAYSHAEGYSTIASGDASHSEGLNTTAAADYSHAAGQDTIASGSYSYVGGLGTISSGSHQHIIGKYNKRNNNFSLFVIGDGVGGDESGRSDIVRVNGGPVIGTGIVEITGTLAATQGISGSLTNLANGTSYLIAGSNVTISTASNGSITISSTGGGGAGSNFFLDTAGAGKIYTTASSVAFPFGETGVTQAANKGADVAFYVSGSAAGTATSLFSGNIVTSASVKVGGDLFGSQATQNIFNTTATTVNFAGAATVAVNIGGNGGTATIANPTVTLANATNLNVNGANPTVAGTSTGTLTLFNTNLTAVNAFGAATNVTLGATGAATTNIRGGTLVGSETTQNVFNTTATTVSAFGAATSITLGGTAGTTTLRNKLSRSGNLSAGSWTTSGISADFVAGTFTDNSSAGGSTIASRSAVSVNTPTYASNNSITVTDAANLYISNAPSPGTNTIITNSYALWVDAGNSRFDGDVLPGADLGSSLGSPSKRWANIYTGDLHLRNDRGNWTIVEEEDYLTITNNLNGKKYKILMEEI